MSEQRQGVVLVGESPGRPSRHAGRNRQVWPITRRLEKWFRHAGLPADLAATAPLLNARAAYAEKPPTHGEIEGEWPALEEALGALAPRLILAMGRSAQWAFFRQEVELLAPRIVSLGGEDVTVLPVPHPSGRNRWLNQPEADKEVGSAIRGALGSMVSPITTYGEELSWEDVVRWSEDVPRPEVLEGHVVIVRKSETHHNLLDVELDGAVVGRLRSARVNPFVARTKNEPYAWYHSPHSGSYYREAGDAANAMVARILTGAPPEGQHDVGRWWAWENRCYGRGPQAPRLSGLAAWLEVRGPYTPEHPFGEPIRDDWPPCP